MRQIDPSLNPCEAIEQKYEALLAQRDQLLADRAALVAFSEMTAETCPRYCADDIASTSFSADFRSEYNMKRTAIEPILARRRASQGGGVTWQR